MALVIVTQPLPAMAKGVPAFAVTAPNGATGLLIGTMHIAYPDLLQPSPRILDGYSRLVVEHVPVPSAPDLAKPHPLLNFLSGSELRVLQDRLNCAADSSGIALAWFLPLFSDYDLGQVAYIPCPHQGGQARDRILATAAEQKGIPIESLETNEAVQKQRDQIPLSTTVKIVKYGLGTDLLPIYADLIAAFNQGDFERIAEISGDDGLADAEKNQWRRLMVEERNAAWRVPLEAYLAKGGTAVMVGAGHLTGHGGLIEILKADGFRVRKVELPTE